MPDVLTEEQRFQLSGYQRNEITEHHIYLNLAKRVHSREDRDVLERIAADELRHYHEWKSHTGRDIAPVRWKVILYGIMALIFGYTFAIKLMERGEDSAQENYRSLITIVPEAERIAHEEQSHENALIDLLDEQRLRYTGSMVLGLNDALVELTGALAGFTLALRDTDLIALTGLITGIAAALSMAASEYLSTKADEGSHKNPVTAAVYTGGAYIITVVALVVPYLVFENYYFCLAFTLTAAVLIIAFFNYYISVAKDLPFRERFLEMAGLSLGVAALSFGIGYLVRIVLGVDV